MPEKETLKRPAIRPFLMFTGQAEEAMRFYVSLFPGSEVLEVQRYAAGEPGPAGTVKKATFSLGGQQVLCTDTFVKHAFGFTPSISFFVDCESEGELRRLCAALLEGGSALMPPDAYGFSTLFAWVADRFGVTWQLNLA